MDIYRGCLDGWHRGIRDNILICYSGVINKLFSILANASLIQNWFWNMSSVPFSLCFFVVC